MADADLDADWKPKGRPTSTIALSFSAALDDAFLMSDTLDSLSHQISRKRQSITYQKTELEQLEAKLREMEVELHEKQAQLPSMVHNGSGSGRSITQRRKGLEAVLEPDPREDEEEETTAEVIFAARSPPTVSETRPPSSPSLSNNSKAVQVVQKRRKTVDGRSRYLPNRGRP